MSGDFSSYVRDVMRGMEETTKLEKDLLVPGFTRSYDSSKKIKNNYQLNETLSIEVNYR